MIDTTAVEKLQNSMGTVNMLHIFMNNTEMALILIIDEQPYCAGGLNGGSTIYSDRSKIHGVFEFN